LSLNFSQQILAAVIRHKLTPVEWQLLAAMLICEGNRVEFARWGYGGLLKPGSTWKNPQQVSAWAFTKQGYSKAVHSLEARGWIRVERDGRRGGPTAVELLPINLLGAAVTKETTVADGSASNKRCKRPKAGGAA